MKQKTMAIVGIAGTAILMAALAVSVLIYSKDSSSTMGLAAMSMLSTTLMVFLVIFAVFYTRPKPSDDYLEKYRGICSRCGAEFGEDDVCPKCRKVRIR